MKTEDLTEDQLADLMRRYYSGEEKVSDLITAFGLDVKPSQLASTFPPERLKDPCRQCGGTMMRRRIGRGSYHQVPAPHCEICGHFEARASSWRRCGCQSCREEEASATRARRIEIAGVIEAFVRRIEQPPVALADLTVRQRLYLAALATAYADEDLKVLQHVGVRQRNIPPVAPRPADVNTMLQELWNAGVIGVMPNTPQDAFRIEEKPGHPPRVASVSPDLVLWEIRIVDADPAEILVPNCTPSADEALVLWRDMSQSETLAFLESERDRFHIDAAVGDKTAVIVREIVEQYSTAESYCFVWMGTRDLTAAIRERYMNRTHIANSLPIYIKSKVEHYRARNFEPRQYGRHDRQSLVSHILYNHVLGIGDLGFTLRPTTENLNPITT